jgi:hypothetical protein
MPEAGPEEAVEASQRRPRPLAFEYADLLSEREDLQRGIAGDCGRTRTAARTASRKSSMAQP